MIIYKRGEETFESILSTYQIIQEKSMKGRKFIFMLILYVLHVSQKT